MCECEYGDVGVIDYVQCEWSGHNAQVNMECASSSTVICE